jgi:hypothetical protein
MSPILTRLSFFTPQVNARSLSCPMCRADGPHETDDSSNDEPAHRGDDGEVQPEDDAGSHTYCVVDGGDHHEAQRKDAEHNRDDCECSNSRCLLRP